MSEEELNSYRFGRGEEPTDQMLEAIMRDAMLDVKERAKKAAEVFRQNFEREYAALYSKWAIRIENARNGIFQP